MATEERDHTADWIVPAERRPPSAFDLQRQIELAMAVAKAAEEAALDIGEASLEAAEQARRAAAHAERSAEAALAAANAAAGGEGVPTAPLVDREPAEPDPGAALVAEPFALAEADSEPEPPTVAAPPEPAVTPPSGHESIPGSELPAGWSPVAAPPPIRRPARPTAQPDPFDERMVAFRERAERVMARLQRLEAASPVS